MESKLEFIIAALENEEKSIKESIKEFLEDGEYQFAFFQSKGLSDISYQINRLKRIEDPLFEKKHFLKTRIQNIEKSLSKHLTGSLKDYLLNELQTAENELEIFELRQSEEFSRPEETALDNCIQLLFSKQIKSLTITFSKKINLFATLELQGKKLLINVSGLKKALSEGWLDNYHIRLAEKLGFRQLTKSKDLKLKLLGSKEDLIHKAKLILARLTFDILPDGCIDREGTIELRQ